MAVFVYQASDASRRPRSGTIAADTPRQARELLRARGLVIETIKDQTVTTRARRQRPARHAAQLATSMRELATLLGAGIPLLDALTTVSRQQRGSFRTALMQLHERVAAGVGLAESMAEQPGVFDPLCVHMVEVGENTGTLEAVLDQWAEFKERSIRLKDRVITALTYPAFVFVIGVIVTLFLMTYVIPMLLENLLEAGRPLPWPTQVVKAMSDLLLSHGLLLAVLAGAGLAGLVAALRTTAGRRAWHWTLLRLPLIGPMARKQSVGRIAMVVATLMKSGIEFVRAVEITAHSTTNIILREALERSSRDVGAGQDIGRALERTAVFPPMAVQIFSVGQESGRLEEMLERLAADYDRQVTRGSERLTAVLEPVFILALAVFVGFLLLATILPILEAGNVL